MRRWLALGAVGACGLSMGGCPIDQILDDILNGILDGIGNGNGNQNDNGNGNDNSGDEEARLRVVHLSPDAPRVDVCADGARLFRGLDFGDVSDYETVDAGEYVATVVEDGESCASTGLIDAELDLPEGTDTTVVAVDLVDSLALLVLDDDNRSPALGFAALRFVHASPDAPIVDMTFVDGETLFDDVDFGEVGDYVALPAGSYDLDLRDATGSVIALTIEGLELESRGVYTLYATGLVEGSPELDLIVSQDN